MNQVMEPPPVPLRVDAHGVFYVGTTRVPLDTVVYTFNQGLAPEAIVLSYPTLHLADVYAVINYYLYHRKDVDEYIRQREATASRIKSENELHFPQLGIRDRLLARARSEDV